MVIGTHLNNGTTDVKNIVETFVQDDTDLNELVDDAIILAHYIGMVTRADKTKTRIDSCVFVPFTLFPSPFPRQIFIEAFEIQKAMQLLYFRVSNDFEFLIKTLEPVASTNKFVSHQLKLYRAVQSQPIRQPLTLHITRSDYMCHVSKSNESEHEEEYQLKQVEMNIGQLGGNSISNRSTILHRQMLEKVGVDPAIVPDNDADGIMAQGLYQAWKAFGVDDAVFIISRKFHDIEFFQLKIRLKQFSENKIKIALSEPGVLEYFFPEPEYAQKVKNIRKTFAKMWSLEQEDDEIMKIINYAIENPGNYVLKPCEEGGVNNFWDEEIAENLRIFNTEERAAHILMEPCCEEFLGVRPNDEANAQLSNIVSELGIYGYLLGNSSNMAVLRNERNGYMLRSKREDATEGGIHAGGGVHDSPYLF
ncbi:hypothetical protein niasHT_012105 [Heterodera trifolii]|uniref:Glutathione synthetase n=1 Tax=Heterodera trifolii TaxID=157864 RepID=A0ABD2LAR1_9BILA